MNSPFEVLMPETAGIVAALESVREKPVVLVPAPQEIDRMATLQYELTRLHGELQDIRQRIESSPDLRQHVLDAEYHVAEAINNHFRQPFQP